MKNQKSSIYVALIALALPGLALAGNTSITNQTGSGHTVSIEQLYDPLMGSDAYVDQSGTDHTASVSQGSQQVKAYIEQTGNRNAASIDQTSFPSLFTSAVIKQAGDSNTAHIRNAGDDDNFDSNYVSIGQRGTNEKASADVHGSGNIVNLEQNGSGGNEIGVVLEQSHYNTVDITQGGGADNTAYVHGVNTSNNGFFISQTLCESGCIASITSIETP